MNMYGIPNCDTVKKARKFLDAHQVAYEFHDFKKEAPTKALIQSWLASQPLEKLVNKRSTSWRQLDDAQKQALLSGELDILVDHPTLIKRPVVESEGQILVGYKESDYQALINR